MLQQLAIGSHQLSLKEWESLSDKDLNRLDSRFVFWKQRWIGLLSTLIENSHQSLCIPLPKENGINHGN
jgi:hypothetical protein